VFLLLQVLPGLKEQAGQQTAGEPDASGGEGVMLPDGRERTGSAVRDGARGRFPGDHRWCYLQVFQRQAGTEEAHNDGNWWCTDD